MRLIIIIRILPPLVQSPCVKTTIPNITEIRHFIASICTHYGPPKFFVLHTNQSFMFTTKIRKNDEKSNRDYFTTMPDCQKL